MLRTGHRLALAGAVAALVLGVLLNGAHGSAGVAGSGAGEGDSSALVLESSPVAAVAVVGRVRGSAEAELVSVVRLSKSPLLGLVLVSLVGLAAVARAWWRRSRPDRRVASPLRSSTRAPLRAPPALL